MTTNKTRATRFHIDSHDRLPSGALRVHGNLTKTGVFEYARGEGVVREARTDAEVFRVDSLDSLLGAPVTIDHPASFVGVENWTHLAVGTVRKVKAAPPYIEGELLIHDKRAIEMVESGRLQEISLGYSTDVVEHTDSSVADVSQENILYNHAALGPEGWGRLGRDVALRLDSEGDMDFAPFTDIKEHTPMTEQRTDVEDVKPEPAPEPEAKPEPAPEPAPEPEAKPEPAPAPAAAPAPAPAAVPALADPAGNIAVEQKLEAQAALIEKLTEVVTKLAEKPAPASNLRDILGVPTTQEQANTFAEAMREKLANK